MDAAGRRPKYPDFKEELERVAAHPNRRYFIFKSIIVNNLYGVDIMEEAVEICKLRLFLKLVAQVDDGGRAIEPLPDIDFNIRAGNTLVGYASLEDIERPRSSCSTSDLPQRIKEADIALRAFREMQTRLGISARELAEAKAADQEEAGRDQKGVERSLSAQSTAQKVCSKFVKSHQPFHWYVEFNAIMQDGGFDVVIGNPPWKEYAAAKKDYSVPRIHRPSSCGNLYGLCIERGLASALEAGQVELIVQLPLIRSAAYGRHADALA